MASRGSRGTFLAAMEHCENYDAELSWISSHLQCLHMSQITKLESFYECIFAKPYDTTARVITSNDWILKDERHRTGLDIITYSSGPQNEIDWGPQTYLFIRLSFHLYLYLSLSIYSLSVSSSVSLSIVPSIRLSASPRLPQVICPSVSRQWVSISPWIHLPCPGYHSTYQHLDPLLYRSISLPLSLSAPFPQVGPCINIQSTSDLALAESGSASGRCEWGVPGSYGRGSLAGGYLGMSRSPSCLSVRQLDPTRKVKSAVDLVSLVMQEKMASNMQIATNVWEQAGQLSTSGCSSWLRDSYIL